MVSLDDGMRSLIETVRAQRVGGYGNPSADGGVDLSAVLEEIVEKGPYRSDYERVTMPLLYEDVSYDEAVIALSEIAAFLKANWILPNIIRLKSDQNVKTSRKMSQKTQAKPYGCEVGGLCHRRAAGLIAGACQGVERFDSTGM